MTNPEEKLNPLLCPQCGNSRKSEFQYNSYLCTICYGEKILQAQCQKLLDEKEREIEELQGYIFHDDLCILNKWEAGEPTADGGYRSKYAGIWYQSRPLDQSPKCDCSLDKILSKHARKDSAKNSEKDKPYSECVNDSCGCHDKNSEGKK